MPFFFLEWDEIRLGLFREGRRSNESVCGWDGECGSVGEVFKLGMMSGDYCQGKVLCGSMKVGTNESSIFL